MLSVLQNCPLFADIPAAVLPGLLSSVQAETAAYDKGELVFSQLDEPRKIMILLAGSVAICNDTNMGKRNVVALLDQPGELFGEVFVFLNKETYGNYAQVVTAAKILEIPKAAFSTPPKGESEWQVKMISNMMTILARKAYFLNQRLQIVSGVTLRQKIARMLLLHALPDGRVNLRMNREELADYLNTTRPSLSRELMHMQEEGLIKAEKRTIYLTDIEGLTNI